ncbi:MAG: bifunctional methylenetetrahydrofolate dehydrogenase/methenyltetrahydrofolate cyclohydrolase FolD [bacterium]|nr:bifunctional methylenetetrahydrofolate dehydrogenase/methenyltetrahydrofolate cyclohydrolase FolD [bacterium]
MSVVAATQLQGKPVSDAIKARLTAEVASLPSKVGLAVILVGDNPASQAYVGMKNKACIEVGISSFEHRLPASTSQQELHDLITSLNHDDTVHGILLQLPLPGDLDEFALLTHISPAKDVDGFHPVNVGKLLAGLPTLKSCTPYGVMEMLRFYKIDPAGQHVVIVGRSNIVGKPLAAMLVQKEDGANATVTICHSRSKNLTDITKQADILIAAIGQPEFVTADMVREGAVVIDVGINRVDAPDTEKGYKLVGDVAFDTVSKKASAITPVPGGVGPMTIAMLLSNTVLAYKAINGL